MKKFMNSADDFLKESLQGFGAAHQDVVSCHYDPNFKSPYERLESLEQLRALYCGHEIRIADALEAVPPGVDTQADLDTVRLMMAT